MDFSIVRSYSDELKSIISKLIDTHSGNSEAKEITNTVALYILSNNINIKSYLFDEQYSHMGSPVEKLREIINATVDYLYLILNHKDFSGLNIQGSENDIKNDIFEYLKDKIEKATLNKDNYQDFIEYLQRSFDMDIIIDLIRIRVTNDKEKREEFKAILEYMTYSGKNFIEEDELERIQDAITFRLNLLKNYNISYFTRNFFILRSQTKYFSDEYHAKKYFYPEELIKDFKNLILRIERGKTQSVSIQNEARDAVQKQLRLIKQNQQYITRLKDDPVQYQPQPVQQAPQPQQNKPQNLQNFNPIHQPQN